MKEDYERANAREWDLHDREESTVRDGGDGRQAALSQPATPKKLSAATSKAPSPFKPVREVKRKTRPPPNLAVNRDSQAQQSWRSNQAPKTTIRIPEAILFNEDSKHESIAHQNGTFIFADREMAGDGSGFVTFGIWGPDAKSAQATRSQINAWIEEITAPTKSKRSQTFAKVKSYAPPIAAHELDKWKKEVQKAKFRQLPPPDMTFEMVGSFHWPVKEYRPEDILGQSYEALDPIRMSCRCYVVFKDGVFKVMGKERNVHEGVLRLMRTCFQIAAHQINPIRLYLASTEHLRTKIEFHAYTHPQVASGELSAQRTGGVAVRGQEEVDIDQQMRDNEVSIRDSILTTLRKLHYYRGNLKFRIHLGTFLATQYKKDISALDDYEMMTKESQFNGYVTSELGDKSIEQAALKALLNMDGLLAPQDHHSNSLTDVKPVYSVVFTLTDDAGDLCLSMSWNEHFEESSRKWTRLERDTGATAPILDISLQDLDSGLAWHFGIQGAQAIEESRLSKELADFGRSVRIDQTAARKGFAEKPFVVYKANNVYLKSVHQRLKYQYRILPSDYILELFQFQDRTIPRRKAMIAPANGPTIYEACWGLSVYRNDWDTKFGENERLPIGKMVEWEHDADKWFPVEEGAAGTGFSLLMDKLEVIKDVVKASSEDDLMEMVGGMTVG